MNRKESKTNMAQTAKNVLKRLNLLYRDVQFTNLPTIAIGLEFYAQGESAQEILNQVPEWANKRTYILFYLDSCGAI